MKPGDYRFPFDSPVAELYTKALEGFLDAAEWAILSANFLLPGVMLIQFKGQIKFKRTSERVDHDDKAYAYRSTVAGYVVYGEDSIDVLPMIHINPKGTLARAVVPSRSATKENLSASLIRNFAQMTGIKLPILDENLAEAMKLYSASGGVVTICEGKDAVNARPEVIELIYELKTTIGKTDALGNIDYKEKNFVHNVPEGEKIARYHPAVEAFPGRDVFNQVIKPIRETPFTYKMGPGLRLVPERNLIYSSITGILNIGVNDNTLSVTDEQVIDGDIDLKSGNINAVGNLLVKGNVTPGFNVQAKGNITVEGSVEESAVVAGRNLTVKGGITGNGTVEVTVGGVLHTGFIRNGRVRVIGDIEVGQFIMNSVVQSGGRVRAVTEKKGKIVGGTITAKNAIECFEAGNPTGVKTALITGMDPEKERVIAEINDRIKQNNENIVKLKNSLGNQYFENPQAFFKRLPPGKIPVVKKVIEGLKASIDQRKTLDQELAAHTLEGTRNRLATITILHQGHEGLTLQITQATLTPKAVASPTCFVLNTETNTIMPTSVASAAPARAAKS